VASDRSGKPLRHPKANLVYQVCDRRNIGAHPKANLERFCDCNGELLRRQGKTLIFP
jgi:hypothetical protein